MFINVANDRLWLYFTYYLLYSIGNGIKSEAFQIGARVMVLWGL